MRNSGHIFWISLMLLFTACNPYSGPPGNYRDLKTREGPEPKHPPPSITNRIYDHPSVSKTTTAKSLPAVVNPSDTIIEYFIPDYTLRLSKPPFSNRNGSLIQNLSPAEKNNFSSVRNDYVKYRNFKHLSISGDKFLSLQFDNDIFDNTDYYYTSGLKIEFFHPALSYSPFYRLMFPGLRGSVNYYSISLVQNLYTPVDPDQLEIQQHDRPFSSYLYLGLKLISNDLLHRLRLSSELDLGVLGPAALGGYVQRTIHRIEPTGWANQIDNDIVVNYNVQIEKGLVNNTNTEIIVSAGLQAGTLYDNLNSGVLLRFGRFNPYFSSIFPNSNQNGPFRKRLRYYFTSSVNGTLVAYDASLQGGMFNKSSIYYVSPDNINRFVMHARAGIGVGIGKFSLEAEQVFLTPEFYGGRSHLWFRIRTTFSL